MTTELAAGHERTTTATPELLRVERVKKYFPVEQGLVFRRITGWIQAVDDLSFSIAEGETFSLVGESGCGKTTTAKLILGLEKPTDGSIFFHGQDISAMTATRRRQQRLSIQAVFQDPHGSLDPRMRIGSLVAEPLDVAHAMPRKETEERVKSLLVQVKLDARVATSYPHELSGGQRQRVALARALALNPSLLVLDEPVTALDVSIQGQILNLLKELQGELGLTYLLIAHNLATVRYMSHRVGIMYLGRMVETAPSEDFYRRPLHPYSAALLSAALPSRPRAAHKKIVLHGEIPSPLNPPPGCRFHTRCFSAKSVCSEVEPKLTDVGNGHLVACHRS